MAPTAQILQLFAILWSDFSLFQCTTFYYKANNLTVLIVFFILLKINSMAAIPTQAIINN
jgi:hypothetical protein